MLKVWLTFCDLRIAVVTRQNKYMLWASICCGAVLRRMCFTCWNLGSLIAKELKCGASSWCLRTDECLSNITHSVSEKISEDDTDQNLHLLQIVLLKVYLSIHLFMGVCVHTWRSEDSLQELLFPLYCEGLNTGCQAQWQASLHLVSECLINGQNHEGQPFHTKRRWK